MSEISQLHLTRLNIDAIIKSDLDPRLYCVKMGCRDYTDEIGGRPHSLERVAQAVAAGIKKGDYHGDVYYYHVVDNY